MGCFRSQTLKVRQPAEPNFGPSEFYGYRLAVGGSHFEKLALLESERPG